MSTNEMLERLFDEDDDSEIPTELNEIVQEAGETPKAINDKGKAKKKRWRWSDEMVDYLLKCFSEMKTESEFQGKDFEADLVKLYGEVRIMMAKKFESDDFGPVNVTAPGDNLNKAELGDYKVNLALERKQIKTGYERVKEKSKAIRQDYRKAVTEGRRSGSGKLICENWDILKHLWGGSPSVVKVNNSIMSMENEEEELGYESSNEEAISPGMIIYNNDSTDIDQDLRNESAQLQLNTSATSSENIDGGSSGNKRKLSGTAKYVDNKRKMLEKNLSAHQRDQIYLNVARDDLKVKENMVSMLTEATVQSTKAMEKIADSIASVGKSIGDGLALLAAAFAPPKQVTPRQLQPPRQQQQPSFSESYQQPMQPYGQFYHDQQQYPPQNSNNLSEKQYHNL